MAGDISRDYQGRDLVMVGVLKGAFIFLADLVRELSFPVEIDFVRLSSYGSGTSPTGEVHISKDVELSLKGRDVLIVEDIMDLGFTLGFLRQHLATHLPKSLKICCLIDKRDKRGRAGESFDFPSCSSWRDKPGHGEYDTRQTP